MNRRATLLLPALAAVLAALPFAGGCGDKIAIPEAVGLFSVNAYYHHEALPGAGARQLCIANSLLFVIADDGSLTKRFQNFEETARVDGLADPTAVARDEEHDVIFVWEAGAGRLSAWAAADLAPLGATELPELGTVTHLGAAAAGVDEFAPGAVTFVYLADADSLVVHRYAWSPGAGATPRGILCNDEGVSARAVKLPAGMTADLEGRLLVCDADTSRNWVNRFDPTPTPADTVPGPAPDPLRGTAVIFAPDGCPEPATAAYTLGDAPECGEDGWSGGPSAAAGEFHSPVGVAVDGSGRIFVADRDNARFQVFDAAGAYDLEYNTDSFTAAPAAIAVVDKTVSESRVHYGAYVFVVAGESGALHSFISSEEFSRINTGQPPPPQ